MTESSAQKPCDQCHRRKVRCNYEVPCNRCRDSHLECTHSIVRKKRGPRKGRGAVLDKLRANSGIPELASEPVSPHGSPFEQRTTPQSSVHRQSDATSGTNVIQQHPINVQQSAVTSYPQSHAMPLALDDFQSFDEFTQHVLADSNYFETASLHEHNLLGGTPNLPSVTPLDSGPFETPRTAFATSISLERPETFEVTPIVERSIDLFFKHIYPTYPLLAKSEVQAWTQSSSIPTRSQQVLIWSICASTLVMVDNWPDLGWEQRTISARRFIRKCLQLRLEWDYIEQVEFHDILASHFIANAYFELKCRRSSWAFVREAINLATIAGLHNDASDLSLTDDDQLRRKRAYALLFISERGAAVLEGSFPVSILTAPPLPNTVLPGEDPSIIAGLMALHGLFSLLDFKFVKLWNDPSYTAFGSSSHSDLSLLQTHLRELTIAQTGLSDVQRADVLVTQHWLRLIFWQAALRHGYISTASADSAFNYNYPIDIAMDLCQVVKNLPPVAIQVHGLGIFEKQFEIAYSLMDTLALSGTTQPEHHECLRYLLLSLSASPNSRQIYVRTLEKKMDGQHQNQKYRSLGGVQLLRDDGSRHNSRRQSGTFAPSSSALPAL